MNLLLIPERIFSDKYIIFKEVKEVKETKTYTFLQYSIFVRLVFKSNKRNYKMKVGCLKNIFTLQITF